MTFGARCVGYTATSFYKPLMPVKPQIAVSGHITEKGTGAGRSYGIP